MAALPVVDLTPVFKPLLPVFILAGVLGVLAKLLISARKTTPQERKHYEEGQ